MSSGKKSPGSWACISYFRYQEHAGAHPFSGLEQLRVLGVHKLLGVQHPVKYQDFHSIGLTVRERAAFWRHQLQRGFKEHCLHSKLPTIEPLQVLESLCLVAIQ